MKLLIGSQNRIDGWTSFDIQPGPGVDLVGDCGDLSRFAAGSIEAIYASHVLEHIPYRKTLDIMKEWLRVLQPGGTLMVAVPDLEMLCRLYIRPDLTPEDRMFVTQMIYGGQADDFDTHYIGFDIHLLRNWLHHVGFADIVRVSDFKLLDDTSALVYRGLPISLNVTAKKPG